MMLFISCPNCGGEEEPWFFKASPCVKRKTGNVVEIEWRDEKPFIQDCCKCGYAIKYNSLDTYSWGETRLQNG